VRSPSSRSETCPNRPVDFEAYEALLDTIGALFDLARTERPTALVLAFQADRYLLYGLGGGFRRTLDAIETGAAA
jgi:hypothetical protein